MNGNEMKLQARARRAYELGGLRASLPILALTLPMAFCASMACHQPFKAIACGVLLSIAAVGFLWRGQGYAKGVSPGLLAGFAAFALPTALHYSGVCCTGQIEALVCVASGLAAGGAVAWWAAKLQGTRRQRLIASGVVATLAGALGCSALGLAAMGGLAIGILLAAVPVFVLLERKFA